MNPKNLTMMRFGNPTPVTVSYSVSAFALLQLRGLAATQATKDSADAKTQSLAIDLSHHATNHIFPERSAPQPDVAVQKRNIYTPVYRASCEEPSGIQVPDYVEIWARYRIVLDAQSK